MTRQDELFGELRAQLAAADLDSSTWRQALCDLLVRAEQALGEARYQDAWVPYLFGLGEAFWSDASIRALASSPHLERLELLDLGHNRIGDEGARALASSPHLRCLTCLELEDNPIGAAGHKALATSPYLSDEIRQEWA